MPADLMDAIGTSDVASSFRDSGVAQEDAALVAGAKTGDAHAFELLVERHKKRIFFVVQRITRTQEDAEDVVQQSFQKAFTHLGAFEGRSAFSTWLTRIAITEALMFLRKSRGSREVLIDDLSGSDETASKLEFPDASPDPEAVYSRREQVQMLSDAMNELSPGIRKALQLRDLDERSSEEAARIMGISLAALKGRMFHGRRKLRERLRPTVKAAWRSARKASRRTGDTRHVLKDQVPCNACG